MEEDHTSSPTIDIDVRIITFVLHLAIRNVYVISSTRGRANITLLEVPPDYIYVKACIDVMQSVVIHAMPRSHHASLCTHAHSPQVFVRTETKSCAQTSVLLTIG